MRELLISLGAGIGAPARYVLDKQLKKFHSFTIPAETLLINMLGSFVLGITVHRSANVSYLLGTGFAGAFTTWSTFMVEVHDLFRTRKHLGGLLYLILTLVLGIAAAALGNSIK
jgi:CrcB protein